MVLIFRLNRSCHSPFFVASPKPISATSVLCWAPRIPAPTFVAAALDAEAVRGFVLGDRLAMVVHRKGAGEPGEQVLVRRAKGESAFRAAAGEPGRDEERIAVRWVPLAGGRSAGEE